MKKTTSAIISAITIFLLTCSGIKGQENGKIWFTQVPDWGNAAMDLIGRVDVNPQEYMVAGIIFVEEAGGWWTKPSFANPAVAIGDDSTFILDFTSGGLDAYSTRLLTVLVPIGYPVPLLSGAPDLPADLLENPYSIVARPHGDRVINWSGINWIVKRSVDGLPLGPGPNVFSSEETQVFIDEEDCLHLNITNNGNNQWFSSEVIADTSFGYGTYKFKIKSRVDNFDVNSVNGLFTWDDIAIYSISSPDNFYREYDVEFSYWSDPANDAAQYVIQPYYNPGNIFRFPMGPETNTTHLWIWKKDTIVFRSLNENSAAISEFEYTGDDFHYPGTENVRLNLWLIYGLAPLVEQEVIISGFEFENILPSPQNVMATEGEVLKVDVTWDMEPGTFYGIYRGTSAYLSDAVLLNEEWISQETYEDTKVDTGVVYYYWVRASDNPQGSNTTGYSSGFSNYDTGWATDSNMYVENIFPSSNIQVMPNPCKGSFRINFAENTSGFFQLYDQTGNLIMLRTVYSGEVLRTDGLSPGMYIMKLMIKDISYYKKIAVSY